MQSSAFDAVSQPWKKWQNSVMEIEKSPKIIQLHTTAYNIIIFKKSYK